MVNVQVLEQCCKHEEKGYLKVLMSEMSFGEMIVVLSKFKIVKNNGKLPM